MNQVTAKKPVVQGSKQSIWPYIRLQLKLAFTPSRAQTKTKKILSWVAKVLIFALALAFIFFFIRALVSQSTFISGKAICIALFTIFQLILLGYSVSVQVRRLYKPNDLRLTSSMPYSSFQKYLGEIIAIYIRLAIYSLAIFYPILLIYGWAGKIINVAFVFSALLTAIVIPWLPFAISLVICVPFMFLGDWLRNKHITKLILFLVLFAAILTLYALLLKFMADWYIHAKNPVEVMKGIAAFLDGLNKPYNFCYFTSEICLGNKIYINLPILIGITAGFGAIGIAITKPLYEKFSSQGIIEGDATIKHVKIREITPYKAIYLREIKQILRTPAYAYFYLGVAFSMPFMTYLVSDIVKKLGAAQVGTTAFYGFGLMIICIIISLIGSYAANVVSREGKQFYITKVSPLSFRKQLFTKALVNFTVSFIGLLLCLVVLAATSMGKSAAVAGLDGKGFAFIFLISTFFLIGITFNGVNIDLIRPKIDMLGGQENDTNILIQLVISIVITAIISIVSIAFCAINQQIMLYIQLGTLGLILIYAVVNFLVWWFTCEKKFSNLEIK